MLKYPAAEFNQRNWQHHNRKPGGTNDRIADAPIGLT
jgi:hypothetical protein